MKQLLKDMGITALGVFAAAALVIGTSAISSRSRADTEINGTEICSQMADNFDETIEKMRNDPELMRLIEEHGDGPGLLEKIAAYYGADAKYAAQQNNSYDPNTEIGIQPAEDFDETIEKMRNDPGLAAIFEEYGDDPELLEKIAAYCEQRQNAAIS